MNKVSSKDLYASILTHVLLLLSLAPFCWIIFEILRQSLPSISFSFLYQNPENLGRSGGIASVLISSSLILIVALTTTLPIGFACALYLSDWGKEKSSTRKILRNIIELLAGIPSIIYGLFGSAFFCLYLKLGYSILAGGLTLSCMILPLFISIIEEGLKTLPTELKTTCTALNFSKFGRIVHLVLPFSMPSIAIASVLSVGRALSETAALLFTSGYVMRTPESLFDSGRTLSVHIYDLAINVSGGEQSAYKTALVLLIAIVAINKTTNALTKIFLNIKLGHLAL